MDKILKMETRMVPVISDTKKLVAYYKHIGKTYPFNLDVITEVEKFWDLDPEEVYYLEKTMKKWLRKY